MNITHLTTTYDIGAETLHDILQELQRPGYDPRDDLSPPVFASNVMEISELKIGDILDGVVRNITDFGAFVDIGLHNDGLVHKSQMANRYIAHPLDVVHLNQCIKVRVLDIDLKNEKISLTMKSLVPTDSSPKQPLLHKSQEKKPSIEKDNEPSLGGKIKFI